MKKKAPSKQKSAPAKAKAGKVGKADKAASKGAAASSKAGAAAKAAKASAAGKPAKAGKASPSAKAPKAPVKAAGKAAKIVTKPAAKKTAGAKASSSKPAVKPAAAKHPAAKTPAPKPAALDRKPARDEDEFEGVDLLAALSQADGLQRGGEGPVAEVDATKEEKAGLEKVMASLSRIFGGKDFMSDAELDALLDDKMASGEIPPSAALDPLDEAQSLIYEAWNSEDVVKVELAHRALDLSPDCADAYIILAEEDADSVEAAMGLYRKAVEAAKRSLDPSLFATSAGKFWSIMETRPYMRARLGLAESLWELGKKDEALQHLRDLLRLNPSDDQGVRYILVQCLLESGADEELGALMDRYAEDTSPVITFSRALWLFRRNGPGPAADAALADAVEANPHVAAFLLKRKKLSKRVHAASRPGSEEEAEAYAGGAMGPWQRTLGALDWLSERNPP
jgi:tetratricopeptide (TPR) repeat protein